MKINKNAVIATFGLCILYSGNIAAADGSYIGIGFGSSTTDISDSTADSIDDSDSYIKILGGTPLNQNISMEFGYVDFGSFSAHYPFLDETDTFDGNALYAAAAGKISFANKFSLVGKIGLDYWSADIKANFDQGFGPESASGDGSDLSLMFGVGLAYDFANNLSIRVEIEKFQDIADGVNLSVSGLGSVEVQGSDVDLFGGTLVYMF